MLRLKYLGSESVADSVLPRRRRAAICGPPRRGARQLLHSARHELGRVLRHAQPPPEEGQQPRGNRLQRAGEIRIDWHAPGMAGAATVDNIVEQVTSISATSWKVETGNSLDKPDPSVHQAALGLATDRQWLSIWLLSLDGRPAAMEYQLIADSDVFACARISIPHSKSFTRIVSQPLHAGASLRPRASPLLHGSREQRVQTSLDRAGRAGHEISVYGRTLTGRALAAWEIAVKPATVRLRELFARKKSEACREQDD